MLSLTKKNYFIGITILIAIFSLASMLFIFKSSNAKDIILPYVEEEKLYRSTKSSQSVKIADKVDRLLHYNLDSGTYLYLTLPSKRGTESVKGNKLILLDNISDEKNIITENVLSADLSAETDKIVVWDSNHKIKIFNKEGKFLSQVDDNGASPIFSHNGRYIAYQKLAATSSSKNLHSLTKNSPYGIAIYDTKTEQEKVLTQNNNDFSPVGFSKDMRKLYFNSGRSYESSSPGVENHVASLWSVDLDSKEVERLTNNSKKKEKEGKHTPIISEDAIWSSDRKIVISSNNKKEGVWKFSFNEDGELIKSAQISEGTSPRWLVKDEKIAVRAQINGERRWKTLNIKKNN